MKLSLTLFKDISRQATSCLSYILLFLVVLTIYHSKYINPVYFIGIPAILIIYMLIERYCFNVILFITFHALCFIPFVMIKNLDPYYRWLYIIMLAVEFSKAIYIWKTGTDKPYEDIPWFLLVAVLFCSILAHFGHFEKLERVTSYIGFLILIVHFLRIYITGLGSLILKSKQVTSMPVKRITLTNFTLFGFFIFAFVIAAGFNKLFQFEKYIYALGDFLLKCLKVLYNFMLVVLGIIRALISKNSTVSDSSKNVQSLNRAMMDAAKPSLIAQILTGLLIICFVIIMIILLYRLAVRIIKILLSKYTQDTDIILTLKADAKETKKIENEQTLTERIKHFFAKTYEEKIRQAYRMKILSYKELKINDSDTAKMIARNVETQYEENIDKLTNVYEKARYGNEKVSPEEAEEGGIIC